MSAALLWALLFTRHQLLHCLPICKCCLYGDVRFSLQWKWYSSLYFIGLYYKSTFASANKHWHWGQGTFSFAGSGFPNPQQQIQAALNNWWSRGKQVGVTDNKNRYTNKTMYPFANVNSFYTSSGTGSLEHAVLCRWFMQKPQKLDALIKCATTTKWRSAAFTTRCELTYNLSQLGNHTWRVAL